MASHIEVDPHKCCGCRCCELMCSHVKEGGFAPSLARIRINRPDLNKEEAFTCKQCEDAECIKACPVGAISKRSDGVVIIDEKKCVGCQLCVKACPYHAMFFDFGRKKAIKCDLCMECIPMCKHDALTVVTE